MTNPPIAVDKREEVDKTGGPELIEAAWGRFSGVVRLRMA